MVKTKGMAETREELKKKEEEELARYREHKTIRKTLWLGHGCTISALYGDDGERQCNSCRIDFRRDSFDRIEEVLRKKQD